MTDREVLARALDALRAGRSGALATVVAVEGSAYQREGAKLFVDAEGQVFGLISGGCLEGEVALAAADAMSDRRTRMLRYDTSDESIFGYGMGCPGIVDVLLEPLPQGEDAAAYRAWLESALQGAPVARAVALTPAGEGELRQIVVRGGAQLGSLGEAALDAAAREKAAQLADGADASATERLGPDRAPVFIDAAGAQARLVIFGAGDDARPLAQFAQGVGMRVHVVDPRPAMATPGRFPGCELSVLQPGRYAAVPLGPECAAVVMGHQLERDEAALAHALSSPAQYVGLLSSRGRRERMLSALEARGALPKDVGTRLCAPVGLDIGAKSPQEIALSIVAEILARRRGRSGGSMGGR